MKYATVLVAAIAASIVSAKPAHRPREHTVIVGGPNLLRYTPDNVMAAVGDTIKFVFQEKNHTLTESTFDKPCKKKCGGFDTKFVPNLENITPGPQRIFKVTNNKPRYFYCRQGNHCGQGMVFALNSKKGVEKFRQRAIQQNGSKKTQRRALGDDLFEDIIDGFDTQGNVGLVIDYPSNGFGSEPNGADLTEVDTSEPPRFALCGSCANAPGNKFIVALVDVDAAKPRLLFLQTGFDSLQPDAAPEDLVSNDSPLVQYQGPDSIEDNDGKPVHRFVFLQIRQPRNFQIDRNSFDEDNFNLDAFYEKNNLQPAQGGAHFVATVGA